MTLKISRGNFLKNFRYLALLIFALLTFGCSDSSTPSAPAPAPVPGQGAAPALDSARQEKMFQEVLKQDPKNLNALIGLGNLMMDLSRYPAAIDAYSKALEISPENVNVRTDMGTCYRRTGQPDKAVEAYRKSLTYQSEHAQTLVNLGVVLANDLGDYDGALEAWEKFLKVAPGHRMAEGIRQEVARLRAIESQGQQEQK